MGDDIGMGMGRFQNRRIEAGRVVRGGRRAVEAREIDHSQRLHSRRTVGP